MRGRCETVTQRMSERWEISKSVYHRLDRVHPQILRPKVKFFRRDTLRKEGLEHPS